MDINSENSCQQTNGVILMDLKPFKANVEMPSYKKLEEVADFCVLNTGTDDQLDCVGYRKSVWKRILFYTWTIVNVGLPLLLIHWKPEWGVWWKHSRCSVALADCLLLRNAEKQYFVKKIMKKFLAKLPHDFTHFLWSSSNEVSGNVDSDAGLTLNQSCYFKYFIHQEMRYVWDHRINSYRRLSGYDVSTKCSDLFDKFKGFSEEQQHQRLALFGLNSITVEVKSYQKLLVEEVLNPFYIFQIFSIILWSNDNYFYFAGCIFVVSLISISVSLYKTRKQSETLHDMVSASSSSTVTVLQKIKTCEISSSLLVPGDVIVIPPHGCIMNCDAVLVAGNCIVNESMLTGESVPVTKTPLIFQEGEIYSPQQHKRHTLFCGTKVIQTRYYEGNSVSAVVVRTGFSTSKGELVRAILFPKPIDFKFYRDAIKFIGFLAIVAGLGMVYAMITFIMHGASAVFIIKRVFDIVTIVVPPSLPAAMTVGSVYAQSRLKDKDIFCISPNRINVAGKLKLFCFDKTGTLTEDGLDMWGVVPVVNGSFQTLVMNPAALHKRSSLLAAMASCHSLTIIDGQLTGDPLDLKVFQSTQWELVEPFGETAQYDRFVPTVVRPFTHTSATAIKVLLERQPNQSGFNVQVPTVVRPPTAVFDVPDEIQETEIQAEYEIGIVRQFPFSSTLQMMSVITRTLGEDHMVLYAKGAPEKMASICHTSTIPSNFNELLRGYTVQGFRVIAMAWKPLDKKLTWHHAQRIKRNELENELNFLGLSIMQNALKPETTPVIDVLNAANIRTVMVTGDNILTAISVARNCCMIGPTERIILVTACASVGDGLATVKCEPMDTTNTGISSEANGTSYTNNINLAPVYHFATDGKTFAIVRKHHPDLLLKLAIRGTIFARMTPDQKTQLIELFQEKGYIVGMCGDGANDCGALKAAQVGISLSETEASVAAPFTSKIPNVECVPHVIKDGRCALVTSFSVFKFMALYSIFQFVSVLILYTVCSRFYFLVTSQKFCSTDVDYMKYFNNLADAQFLYIDLVIAMAVAISMGYTAAYDKLTRSSPHGTLLGSSILASICLQIILATAFQVTAFAYLTFQPWYIPATPIKNVKFTISMETTIIFCLSSFQYLAVALTISKGKPFRKPVYTNIPLLISVSVLFTVDTILLLAPPYWLEDFFQIKHEKNWRDFDFRLTLLLFVFGHLILSFAVEYFVETSVFKKISRLIARKKLPKHHYKIIEKELLESLTFP